MLGKILYYTFSSSTDLAQSEPAISYDPDYIAAESKDLVEDQRRELRIRYPEKYWLQGLKVGTLDILAESLILTNKENGSRIKSFGEFEREFFESVLNGQTVADKRFEVFITLFSYFHPKTRPVLWRLLITQAYIYNATTKIHSSAGDLNHNNFDQLKKIFNIENTKMKCDWRQPNEAVSEEEFGLPFGASENYLRRQLSNIS